MCILFNGIIIYLSPSQKKRRVMLDDDDEDDDGGAPVAKRPILDSDRDRDAVERQIFEDDDEYGGADDVADVAPTKAVNFRVDGDDEEEYDGNLCLVYVAF